ncbi:50S ribosomal protein L20 [Candidatus Falkowbacteria bacterium CG10_big_fil_rev_8_21_14_0_10_44_15]|uniref:Large ribosomal subunit protein bL20 n=1 Tax=Candidatus Falkowbacteria bacterium CG10_big_fil_rev_8_21_14_0_10_44_15 TaxID=1974569 RepID=A0A2H0UZ34_9BACT|nr:MAG: 50S ribosomal protein L20 [Candidatus Falkowbacteria bacterium CG10_big_fil_rev_8_21_14_0_10_44_15]
MSRVKRGTMHAKRRRNLLRQVKGYKWGRKKLIKAARTATLKAGQHAFADRRRKKADFRRLWQIKINAFAREHNLTYSRLMNLLKKNKVALDRKILADLAVNNKTALANIISRVNK